jgi:ectoine hydroxylase-related dioxygenase (phytanoyl-CoA dioxygenase family)
MGWIKASFPRDYQDWEFGKWVALHSKPNGPEQQIHRDYNSTELAQAKIEPGGIIVALENDTKFIVYKYGQVNVEMKTKEIVVLNQGDILIFNGVWHTAARLTGMKTTDFTASYL